MSSWHSTAALCPRCCPNALSCWQPGSLADRLQTQHWNRRDVPVISALTSDALEDAQAADQGLGLQLTPLPCSPCLISA